MNHYVIFRTAMCPSCRLQGYGIINGLSDRTTFQPCAECEKVIERIVAMEVVEESKL